MGWIMLSDIVRKVVAEVSVDADIFPWHQGEDGKRYYSDFLEPLAALKGQPMRYGLNLNTNRIEFVFFEGCDLDKVMLFKLTWGGK